MRGGDKKAGASRGGATDARRKKSDPTPGKKTTDPKRKGGADKGLLEQDIGEMIGKLFRR